METTIKANTPVSDGILLLDKPAGITSNRALSMVKRLFRQRQFGAEAGPKAGPKAGHGGSLDPLAEGMLPILLGGYTKLADMFLGAVKEYETQWILGVTTDTGDREGKITRRADPDDLSEQDVRDALVRFRGEIMQCPPVYSAIKYKGKPLYKYARSGHPVLPSARRVFIHSLLLTDFDLPRISLKIKCSKGVYIRSMATDLGEALGCGAHVSRLRRTGIDRFSAERMHTFAALEEALDLSHFLLPPEDFSHLMPNIFLSPQERELFVRGMDFPYAPPPLSSPLPASLKEASLKDSSLRHTESPPRVGVFFTKNTQIKSPADERPVFLGLAELKDGRLLPRRVCATV